MKKAEVAYALVKENEKARPVGYTQTGQAKRKRFPERGKRQ